MDALNAAPVPSERYAVIAAHLRSHGHNVADDAFELIDLYWDTVLATTNERGSTREATKTLLHCMELNPA